MSRLKLSELFDGTSSKFGTFQDCFVIELTKIKEVDGYKYIFEELWIQEEWTKYPDDQIPLSLDSVAITTHPDGSAVTESDRKERADRRERMVSKNRRILTAEAAIMKALLKLLSEGLRKQITSEHKNDPVKAYKSLTDTYGPDQSTSSTITTKWINLLNANLPNDGNFGEFFRTFNKAADELEIKPESKAALLAIQTNPKHNFQLQLLPARLMSEIKTSQKLGYDFETTINYIRTADEQQSTYKYEHTKASKPDRHRHAHKVVSTSICKECEDTSKLRCTNCFNTGHTNKTCKLDACWKCKSFHCGHKSHECTVNNKHITNKLEKELGRKPREKSAPAKGKEKHKGDMKDSRNKMVSKHARKAQRQSEESDDSESDDESDSSSSDSESSERGIRFNRHVRVRNINNGPNPIDQHPYQHIIDTGSEEHIVRNELSLLRTQQRYSGPEQAPISIYAANEEELTISARGTIGDYIKHSAYVSNDLGGQNLLSGPRLQRQGFWLIFPPTNHQKQVGCIIADKDGTIMGTTTPDLAINPQDIRPTDAKISIPKIPTFAHSMALSTTTTKRATTLKGVTLSRKDLVMFVHKIGHWTKVEMKWMAKLSDQGQGIDNFPLTEKEVDTYYTNDCDCCPRGHHHRNPISHTDFKAPNTTKKQPHDTTHHDLQLRNNVIGEEIGIDLYEFMGKKKLNVRDKASGYAVDVDIKTKKDVVPALEAVIQHYANNGHHTNQLHKPISTLRKDNESVLKTPALNRLLSDQGIQPNTSPSYEKRYNGLSESDTKTTAAKTISMLECAQHLPKSVWNRLWSLAHNTNNMRPTLRPDNRATKTRYEDFCNERPNLWSRPLLPAGQPVNFSLDKSNQLESVCHIGAYLGPSDDTPGSIRILDMETGAQVDSSNYKVLQHMPSAFVKINPKVWKSTNPVDSNGIVLVDPYNPGSKAAPAPPSSTDVNDLGSSSPTNVEDVPLRTANEGASITPTPPTNHEGANSTTPHEGVGSPALHEGAALAPPADMTDVIERNIAYMRTQFHRHPHRKTVSRITTDVNKRFHALLIKKAKRKVLKALKRKANRQASDNPTVNQAKRRSDWPRFKAAVEQEYQQMLEEHVYDLLTDAEIQALPPDTHVIGSMMNLTVKRSEITGAIDKYKGRLVALGNQQRQDQFDDVRSPTARSSTSKLLISIQAKLGSKSRVIDVKGAYLKASINEERNIYIRLPNGRIAKLNKYLYGLKQAGYQWSQALARTLVAAGYIQSTADPCVFSKWNDEDYIIMSTHVDDFYVISNDTKYIDTLQETLTTAFGTVTTKSDNIIGYLGMAIETKPNGQVKVNQRPYFDKILARVGMTDCKPARTPYSETQSKQTSDNESIDKNEYLEHIGMLNYPAVLTRPDLLYALSRLAQKCSNPTKGDMRRVTRVFRYINGTKDLGLTFQPGDAKITLYGYVDASYHSYPNAASQYGYSFSLHAKNKSKDATFYARSGKMKLVTLSSTEAEYVAAAEIATETIFLRNLLKDIGFPQRHPTVIYEDNKSCIQMIHGAGNHQRTKHINAKYHFTRQQVKKGTIRIKYKNTLNMLADIFTKGSIPAKQFEKLRDKLLNNVTE